MVDERRGDGLGQRRVGLPPLRLARVDRLDMRVDVDLRPGLGDDSPSNRLATACASAMRMRPSTSRSSAIE